MFIVVDADLVVSFFVELYAIKSVQLCQTLDKLLKYVVIVYQFGIQSTLFEAGVLGSGPPRTKRPNLDWVAQTMYFFMCPTLFIILIVAVLSLCREKPHISGRADVGLLMAQHHSLTEGLALLQVFLLVLFVLFQYFLTALARYFEAGSLDAMLGMAIGGLAASLLCILVFALRRRSLQYSPLTRRFLSTQLVRVDAEGHTVHSSSAASGQVAASRVSPNVSPLLQQPEEASRQRPGNGQPSSQSLVREPDVEYLEDSKISVDYFRMKGSVYFSVIAKGEKDELPRVPTPMLEKHASREREEQVKFFNLSSVDGEQVVLSSLVVAAADQVDQAPGRKGLKRDPVKHLSKAEQDMFDFSKKCLICMENKVDCIYSPCNHGGVCFECAKINLIRRNSCYYCRDVASPHQNVFKVYQVQPSTENKKFFRVVKAYFIYDRREEKLYQEFASESNLDDQAQLEAGRDPAQSQAALPTLDPRLSHSQALVSEADRFNSGSMEPIEAAPQETAYRRRIDSFEIPELTVPHIPPSPGLADPHQAPVLRHVTSERNSNEDVASPQVPVSPLIPFPRQNSDVLLPPLPEAPIRRRVASHDNVQTTSAQLAWRGLGAGGSQTVLDVQRSPGLNRIEEVEENYE